MGPSALLRALVFLGVVSAAVGSLGAPLLPTVVAVDRVSVVSSQWVLTITLLVGAVAAPTLGRLSDGPRRRTVILAAIAVVALGCVVAALPLGFAGLLVGRALQGVALALVPLAITVAREALPAERVGPAIVLLGVTTAIGIGVGYPIAGVLVQYAGLHAAFWFGAGVSVLAFVVAARALPPPSDRPRRPVDVVGASLLAVSAAGLLVVLAQGAEWGWMSDGVVALASSSVLVLAGWVAWELRASQPLVAVRLLRHRSVFAANVTVLLIGAGIYPLLSIVVRLVQAPVVTGYGFGATPVIAGLMLVPFSAASFAASRVAGTLIKRMGPERLIAGSCVVLIAALALYLTAMGSVAALVVVMSAAGLGVGFVFAANPVQIVTGVPVTETGSALSFYQVVRTVGLSAGSAVAGTALAGAIPDGAASPLPTVAGYRAAGVIGIVILAVALVVSVLLARRPRDESALGLLDELRDVERVTERRQ